MSMVIANNLAALSALNTLNGNTNSLGKALKKVSSGQRINNAGDDSSGYAISEKMRTQIRTLGQDRANVQNGVSLCKVALGGLDNIKESVARMHDLAMQSTNDTMTDFDRQILQKEYDQLKDNIESIVYETTFNGIHPLYPAEGIYSGKSRFLSTDIVFIIDTTRSMGPAIDNVKKNIEGFADSLTAAGIDYQFGLVDYKEVLKSDPIKTWAFTDDVARFKKQLGELDVHAGSGGGDAPESGLEAIMGYPKGTDNGALSFPFRDGAVKQFIVVTDAPVHYKGDTTASEYTIEETNAALKAQGVKLTYVTTNAGKDHWHRISDGTGGMEVVLPSLGNDFKPTLEEYAKKIITESAADGDAQTWLYIQEGTKANQTITLHVYDNRLAALGIGGTKVNPMESAQLAMDKLDKALEIVLSHATFWGAAASRLEYAEKNIVTAHENTTNAESVIRDADMAKAMADFTKNNVLAQAAQSMLAQANQNSSNVLSLLQ